MKTSIKRFLASGLLAASVALAGLAAVQAGTTNEYGQLNGTPAQATYVAWLAKAGTPPGEVLTEDGYNPAAGPNQGYQSLFWFINVGAGFATPTAAGGDIVNMVFSEPSGTLYTHSFAWSNNPPPQTNQGTVPASGSGASCPVMTGGSQTGDQRTINWTGPAGTYLVYRSTQESNPNSGRSNGRYLYVATVTGLTYTDTITVANNWYIVVPADAGGNPAGCHSAESSATGTPTAVRLSAFRAEGIDAGSLTWAGLYLLGALGIGAAVRKFGIGR